MIVNIVENGIIVRQEEVPDEPFFVDAEADLLDSAEQARRAAYDEVMAGGTRSMARLEEADRAGSEAFRLILREAG